MRFFCVCAMLLFTMGCSNLVTINSSPQGAKCYINQQFRGETPLQTVVTSWALGTCPTITLEKKGYTTFVGVMEKRAQPGYIALDILFYPPLIGLFFNARLINGQYVYALAPIDNDTSATE